MTILRNGTIAQDPWQTVADDADLPPSGLVLVNLARYQAGVSVSVDLKLGVRLPNTADVDQLWPVVEHAAAIELEFPKVGDGRAYSQARILRGRLGYRAELRASGEGVVQDHVYFLQRCGFDVLVLRADQKPDACVAALKTFTHPYQPAADGLPWVMARRRQTRAAVTKA